MQRSTLALAIAVGGAAAFQFFGPHGAPSPALARSPTGGGAVATAEPQRVAMVRLADAGHMALVSSAAAPHLADATAVFRVTAPKLDAGSTSADGLLWVAALGDDDLATALAAAPAAPPAGDAWSLAAASSTITADGTTPLFDDGFSASAGRATQALDMRPASHFTSNGDDAPKIGSGSNGNGLDSGASALVSPAPEPATWGSLLAGLALVGLNLRRRGPRSVAS